MGRDPIQTTLARFEAGGERFALATLRLDSPAPVRFKMATKPGQDVSTLQNNAFFGHSVDSGTSSFLDLQAARSLRLPTNRRSPLGGGDDPW